jgi:membrane dipeptidase
MLSRREFARTAALAALTPLPLLRARRSWPGYERAIVIDALASPGPFNVPNRTGRPLTPAMVDNARSSGITAVNVTVSAGGTGHASFDATIRELGYWMRELAAQPDALLQARSVADIHAAKESGKLGLIFGFQDAVMLEGDVSRLQLFHDFGVRVIQLTYNLRNDLGDGCLEPGNAGLSRFGHTVVERMNQLGMVVDLSHCGQRTTADAIAASGAPVAVTHSGCNTVFEHPRNKRDDELRALAQKGGVIGIYMMPFLNAQGPARIEHFLQHVDHAVQVCGEDHVGVGSDNSITPTVADEAYRRLLMDFAVQRKSQGIAAPREEEVLFVQELNTPRRMETLADQMLARGYSESRVEKILGQNWLRLLGVAWR